MGNYKILLLVRHAKSSWEIGTASDFERPLNERGKVDAPEMGKRIKERKILIDGFVSSPAKRAKSTAEFFCKEYGLAETVINFRQELYHASATVFFEVISKLDNTIQVAAIFSHNPGITEFVNMLVENTYLDNMPTCAVFAVKIFTDDWAGFRHATKELLFFDFPKNG